MYTHTHVVICINKEKINKKSTSMNLLDLPDDLLRVIASSCSTNIPELRLACKQLKGIADGMADEISFRAPTTEKMEAYRRVLVSCPGIRKVSATMCSLDSVASLVVSSAPPGMLLEDLSLKDTHGLVPRSIFGYPPFCRLVDLSLEHNHDVTALPLLPATLRRLSVKQCTSLRSIGSAMEPCAATLRHFLLEGCTGLTEEVLWRVACAFPALESLRLSLCHASNHADHGSESGQGSKGGCRATGLSHLALRTRVPARDIGSLFLNCRSIVSLEVRNDYCSENVEYSDKPEMMTLSDLVLGQREGSRITHVVVDGYDLTRPAMEHLARAHGESIQTLHYGAGLPCDSEPLISGLSRARDIRLDLGYRHLDLGSTLWPPSLERLRIRNAIFLNSDNQEYYSNKSASSKHKLSSLELEQCQDAGKMLNAFQDVARLRATGCCGMERLLVPPSVQDLRLRQCVDLAEVSFSPGPSALRTLHVSCCSRLSLLTTAAPSSSFRELDRVSIRACPALASLDLRRLAPRVRFLDLQDLPGLGPRVGAVLERPDPGFLEAVTLANVSLDTLAPFAGCHRLRSLHVATVCGAIDASPVIAIPNLRSLSIKCRGPVLNKRAILKCRRLSTLALECSDACHQDFCKVLMRRFPFAKVTVRKVSHV
jgi:hypothetical protein